MVFVSEGFTWYGLVRLENEDFGSCVFNGFSDICEGLKKVTAVFMIVLGHFFQAIKQSKQFILN